MSRSLLLVTGAGRSGTSTVAGTLHHLGVHVPGPYLKANASNPRGFYESKWSVDFHNRLLKRANVTIADGRPEAADLMHEAFRRRRRAGARLLARRAVRRAPVDGAEGPPHHLDAGPLGGRRPTHSAWTSASW